MIELNVTDAILNPRTAHLRIYKYLLSSWCLGFLCRLKTTKNPSWSMSDTKDYTSTLGEQTGQVLCYDGRGQSLLFVFKIFLSSFTPTVSTALVADYEGWKMLQPMASQQLEIDVAVRQKGSSSCQEGQTISLMKAMSHCIHIQKGPELLLQ